MPVILMGALLALALLLQPEPAQAFDYLNSQARMWLMHTPSGVRYGPVGLTTSTTHVNWVVTQWGIPAELPSTVTWLNVNDHGAGWQVANQFGSVKWMRPGIVELAQSHGNTLPCGVEYDLFMSPLGEVSVQPGTGPFASQNFALFEEQLPLSALTSIRTGVRANVVWEQVNPRCPNDDSVNYLLAITFQANWMEGQTPKTQWIAYQIDLRTNHVPYAFCPGLTGPVEYCVDDPVQNLGGPKLPLGGATTSYDLEIRNRIVQIIAGGQGFGLHQDLSHWKISGAYYGAWIRGGMIVTSRWDGFKLTAVAP